MVGEASIIDNYDDFLQIKAQLGVFAAFYNFEV
jgi:hypothetical protein